MEKEFAPHELALKLKELGFDETCLAYYNTNNKLKHSTDNCYSNFQVNAPLYSQAFDWFREEKDLYADIYRTGNLFSANIEDMLMGNSLCEVVKEVSYEEAREACLEKLIELCGTL